MSFWSVDGEDVRDKAEEDLPVNSNFDPLPDKTKVLAVITEAGTKERDGNRYAYAVMEIVKPEGYAKRKLFPSFWVFDDNPNAEDVAKKRKNDLKRFTRLDLACGGKLARKDGIPSGDDIAMAFTNKQVIVHVMLMTPKAGSLDRQGNQQEPFNWYSDYWPKGAKELSEAVVQPASGGGGSKARRPAADDDIDGDDIPFITMNADW